MQIPDELAHRAIGLKDQYFDLKGLSAYSSLAVSTLREHINRGSLPAFKIGGKILVKMSEYDRWAEQHRLTKNLDLDSMADEVIQGLRAQ